MLRPNILPYCAVSRRGQHSKVVEPCTTTEEVQSQGPNLQHHHYTKRTEHPCRHRRSHAVQVLFKVLHELGCRKRVRGAQKRGAQNPRRKCGSSFKLETIRSAGLYHDSEGVSGQWAAVHGSAGCRDFRSHEVFSRMIHSGPLKLQDTFSCDGTKTPRRICSLFEKKGRECR